MRTTTKPFLGLTAADLMSPDPVVINQHMTLRAAAHLLSRHQISGAPVVDDAGRCVGVLSTSDFLRWAEQAGQAAPPSRHSWCDFHTAWQMIDVDTLPAADTVDAFMCHDPVLVRSAVTIGRLAQNMLDAHVHRLIVVDDDRRPVGIVSTTDVLGAVVRACHSGLADPAPLGAVAPKG